MYTIEGNCTLLDLDRGDFDEVVEEAQRMLATRKLTEVGVDEDGTTRRMLEDIGWELRIVKTPIMCEVRDPKPRKQKGRGHADACMRDLSEG